MIASDYKRLEYIEIRDSGLDDFFFSLSS